MILGNFFTLTGGDIASTTDYTKLLFEDVKPLLVVFFGLAIGFNILGHIVAIFIKRKMEDRYEDFGS